MTKARAQGPVGPGGVIGILGGGQLGRMLATAAAQLGFRVQIYTPDQDPPASDVASATTIASYTDGARLGEFGARTQVVTYEFENVPAETVEILSAHGVAVYPAARALSIAQDRLLEKRFARSIGAETAPYHAVDDLSSLDEGLHRIGRPAILKTRTLGYDGKGQTIIGAHEADVALAWDEANKKAWAEIGARPSILEGFIDFEMEISIIGARARTGEIALYDAPQNIHEAGILRRSIVPAPVPGEVIAEAERIARRMLAELDYVGVIGIEFFVLKNGGLVVNEFAPRVHNSGHWTIDACACSQFEQHIRAVAGWPLAQPRRHSNAVMENLIGAEADDWRRLASESATRVHLYGKRKTLPGRKMGHVTRLTPIS